MSLVKEEHHPGLVQIPHLRQHLEELREHPQQEGGVEGGVVHQAPAVQNIDHAPAKLSLEPVGDVQGRFCEELLAALGFQGSNAP